MHKLLKTITWLVLLAPPVYLAIAWDSLPGQIALHYDIKGNPDRYGPKGELWVIIAVLTAFSIGIYILLPLIYKIDPKKTAVENKSRLKVLAFAIAIFISFISFVVVYSAGQGGLRLNMRLLFGGIGFLWCILGNYFYNIKPNYFAGLRLPWTLNNEENWKKTHWLAGKLWFAGGLLIIISAFLLPRTFLIIFVVLIAFMTTIIPAIYSYRLYKIKGQ